MYFILVEFREWGMFILEAGILYWIIKEYRYDKTKDDEKKQRRVKTTKKTTKGAEGGETIEETTETSEPIEKP